MKLAAAVLLATLAAYAAPASAQATFTDPANLRGERIRPRDGRELPIDQGTLGLQQLLRKLNTRASLMLIVAHPDDEDGGMLTLYSRGLGARVAMLTLNRGEGGQNAMTGDFEDALGLLRTQELLAADRYLGVDQMFGTEVDFGFSKTKQESFDKWSHERVLYDAVRAIRLYRPLVIASVFIGGVTDGHGQHQVSGEICQEAFKAAGDPNVFPELTAQGILPWQPLKVFARVPEQSITPQGLYDYATGQYVPASFTNYVTGEVSETPPTADVVVHEGTLDPLLTYAAANPADLHNPPADLSTQLSYVQFARIGLGLQRSQIGGNMRIPPAGAFDIAYHLYGSKLTQQAPTARSITAQGETLGTPDPGTSSAEGAPHSRADTFFSSIDTSFESIAALAPSAPDWLPKELHILGAEVDEAVKWNADPATRAGVADLLADILMRFDILLPELRKSAIPDDQKASALHELRVKRVQVNDALALALGLHLSASVTPGACGQSLQPLRADWLLPTQPACVDVNLTSDSVVPVTPTSFSFGSFTPKGETPQKPVSVSVTPLAPGFVLPLQQSLTLAIPDLLAADNHSFLDTPFPYFHRGNVESPVYELLFDDLRNAPAKPPAFPVVATLRYQGATVELSHVLMVQRLGAPEVPLALIQNEAGVSTPTQRQVFPKGQPELDVAVRVHNYSNREIDTRLGFLVMGWKDFPPEIQIKLGAADYTTQQSFKPTDLLKGYIKPPTVTPFAVVPHAGQAVDARGTLLISDSIHRIGYGSLPPSYQFLSATVTPVPVDLKLPAAQKIAYLPGTGDAVPEALASIGLSPTLLTVGDLTPTKLSRFDTVVLGVRTYAAHPDLHGAATQALLDYARGGGNVVVQYQTTEFTADDAPYPLSLGSNEKVVDETAPVKLLTGTNRFPEASASSLTAENDQGASAPGYALLSRPNLISPADFNNWIEERGHGFLSTWDPHYTALLETHDPGAAAEGVRPQLPQRGGLITALLGKGRWTYCAFALYRQLPEAVPGAFRLFMNLLQP